VWIGDSERGHVEAMVRYAQEFPRQDWMAASGYSKARIEAMANFVLTMSRYFKAEAEKYSLPYLEIDHDHFDESVERVVQFLVST